MNDQQELSSTLHDIKQMMERSSRFISLSGLSGIAAGICALCGAGAAWQIMHDNQYVIDTMNYIVLDRDLLSVNIPAIIYKPLFQVGIITFIAAFILSFLFTYLRSRKTGIPIWGYTAQRLMLNVAIPMIAGGLFLLRMIDAGIYAYIAPGCLIFYGLALLNASRYTLPEIRYLAFIQILLGILNLWFMRYGLMFWAVGFGVMHIIYGIVMWFKYERKTSETATV